VSFPLSLIRLSISFRSHIIESCHTHPQRPGRPAPHTQQYTAVYRLRSRTTRLLNSKEPPRTPPERAASRITRTTIGPTTGIRLPPASTFLAPNPRRDPIDVPRHLSEWAPPLRTPDPDIPPTHSRRRVKSIPHSSPKPAPSSVQPLHLQPRLQRVSNINGLHGSLGLRR
jgi:hypothetical protein